MAEKIIPVGQKLLIKEIIDKHGQQMHIMHEERVR